MLNTLLPYITVPIQGIVGFTQLYQFVYKYI